MNDRIVSGLTALGLTLAPAVMKFGENRGRAGDTTESSTKCIGVDHASVSSRLGGGTTTSLPLGTEVDVLSQRQGSAHVSYTGSTGRALKGWVDGQDLTDCDVAPAPLAPPETRPEPTVPTPVPTAPEMPKNLDPLSAISSGSFDGCDAKGVGGDPLLNLLKNRTDEATWQTVSFEWLLQAPWPQSVERTKMDQWSAQDRTQVAQFAGRPVAVEGFLALVRQEGKEACNCGSTTPRDEDYHVWLTSDVAQDRTGAIVVEMTGRMRAKHKGWTLAQMQKLVQGEKHVRISGWILLDPEHPDQVGKTRGTIWEVHPIMKVEVDEDGTWEDLDEAEL
jgi:hypothetical protein